MLSVYFSSNKSRFYKFQCNRMKFGKKGRKTKSATQTESFWILENFAFRFKFGSKTNHLRSQHSFSTPVVKGLIRKIMSLEQEIYRFLCNRFL